MPHTGPPNDRDGLDLALPYLAPGGSGEASPAIGDSHEPSESAGGDPLFSLTDPSLDPLFAHDGVVLGLFNGRPVKAEVNRPILVLGPQRSRKTHGLVLPTLLDYPGPAIVTSIRDDVIAGALAYRASIGTAQVYDPMERLDVGAARVSWNPLDDCRTWDGALGTAYALTDAGMLELREGAFWYGMAAKILASYLFAAARNGYDMADVSRWAQTQDSFESRALLQAAGDEAAITAFEGIVGLEDRIRSSIFGTLMAVLRVFDYESVRVASKTGFDVRAFFDGRPNTLFLTAPPDTQGQLAPLFVALVRRLTKEAYELGVERMPKPGLLLLLDEAGNIAPLSNLDTLATSAAGTGIQLVSIFHDVSQITSLYGPHRARTIANNHSALLVLPGNRDGLTMEMVDSLIGDDRIDGVQAGSMSRAIRRLETGTALCIYENFPACLVKLRSSFDPDLRAKAKLPPVPAPPPRDRPPDGRVLRGAAGRRTANLVDRWPRKRDSL